MNSTRTTVSQSAGLDCWLPTLQLAMHEVFDLMLNYKLEPAASLPSEEGLEMTSMVGLAGQLCGVVTIRCSEKLAANMASRMLGVEAEEAGPEVWDAIGEICNMVAGNFKNKISGLGDGCMLSVPTIINGSAYKMHSMGNDTLKTGFLFEGEPLLLSLEIHR